MMPTLFQRLLMAGAFILMSFTSIQAQEDLTKDIAFFEKQIAPYQDWLDQSGLGTFLHLRDVHIKDNHLVLYLETPFSETDAVIAAWNGLKADYDQLSALTMEEALFYKAAFFMQLEEEQLYVQITDNYDPLGNVLFYNVIYYENDTIGIESSSPRAQIEEVTIEIPDLLVSGGVASEQMDVAWTEKAILRKIQKMASDYFLAPSKRIEGRIPIFKAKPLNGNVLKFDVSDLTKEVVENASNAWCSLIKVFYDDCNHYPREWLRFIIVCERNENQIILTVEVDGRVGSGLFENASRGSYINIEVEHEAEMKEYAEKMAAFFKSRLLGIER